MSANELDSYERIVIETNEVTTDATSTAKDPAPYDPQSEDFLGSLRKVAIKDRLPERINWTSRRPAVVVSVISDASAPITSFDRRLANRFGIRQAAGPRLVIVQAYVPGIPMPSVQGSILDPKNDLEQACLDMHPYFVAESDSFPLNQAPGIMSRIWVSWPDGYYDQFGGVYHGMMDNLYGYSSTSPPYRKARKRRKRKGQTPCTLEKLQDFHGVLIDPAAKQKAEDWLAGTAQSIAEQEKERIERAQEFVREIHTKCRFGGMQQLPNADAMAAQQGANVWCAKMKKSADYKRALEVISPDRVITVQAPPLAIPVNSAVFKTPAKGEKFEMDLSRKYKIRQGVAEPVSDLQVEKVTADTKRAITQSKFVCDTTPASWWQPYNGSHLYQMKYPPGILEQLKKRNMFGFCIHETAMVFTKDHGPNSTGAFAAKIAKKIIRHDLEGVKYLDSKGKSKFCSHNGQIARSGTYFEIVPAPISTAHGQFTSRWSPGIECEGPGGGWTFGRRRKGGKHPGYAYFTKWISNSFTPFLLGKRKHKSLIKMAKKVGYDHHIVITPYDPAPYGNDPLTTHGQAESLWTLIKAHTGKRGKRTDTQPVWKGRYAEMKGKKVTINIPRRFPIIHDAPLMPDNFNRFFDIGQETAAQDAGVLTPFAEREFNIKDAERIKEGVRLAFKELGPAGANVLSSDFLDLYKYNPERPPRGKYPIGDFPFKSGGTSSENFKLMRAWWAPGGNRRPDKNRRGIFSHANFYPKADGIMLQYYCIVRDRGYDPDPAWHITVGCWFFRGYMKGNKGKALFERRNPFMLGEKRYGRIRYKLATTKNNINIPVLPLPSKKRGHDGGISKVFYAMGVALYELTRLPPNPYDKNGNIDASATADSRHLADQKAPGKAQYLENVPTESQLQEALDKEFDSDWEELLIEG